MIDEAMPVCLQLPRSIQQPLKEATKPVLDFSSIRSSAKPAAECAWTSLVSTPPEYCKPQ